MALTGWRRMAVAATIGLVVGAAGLRTVEAFTVDAALAQQRETLDALSQRLRGQQAELEVSQAKVTAQADQLRQIVGGAVELTDGILAGQGAAVDRLKKVITTVRALRDELRAFPSP